jgi:hypothetical protein
MAHRAWMLSICTAVSVGLSGCAGSFAIGRPAVVEAVAVPPARAATIEPNGAIVEPAEAPEAQPIDTVITGMAQAQTLRTLVRQLAR